MIRQLINANQDQSWSKYKFILKQMFMTAFVCAARSRLLKFETEGQTNREPHP